jgi:hypothetical protein
MIEKEGAEKDLKVKVLSINKLKESKFRNWFEVKKT